MLLASPLLAADTAPAAAATQTPPAATYEVWGYRWDGAQWVRQPQYNYSTTDVQRAANYAAQIDRYPGWTATTNIPPASMPAVRRTFGGRFMRGARGGYVRAPMISIGGFTFHLPNVRVPAGVQASDTTDSSFYDNFTNYGDTSQIDASTALQDQINQQTANDNQQELLDEQNFENTENMINSQQEALNAQMGP